MGHDGHYGGTRHLGGLEVCDQDKRRDANLSLNDVSQISQQPPRLGVVFLPHSEAEGHSHAQKNLMLTTVRYKKGRNQLNQTTKIRNKFNSPS